MRKSIAIVIFCLAFFGVNLSGQFNFPFKVPKVALGTQAIELNSKSFYVIVNASMRSGWGIYWKNSGGVTTPTTFSDFKLPKGVTLEKIYYPTPIHKVSQSGGLVQHAFLYKKSVDFLLKFNIDWSKILQKGFLKGSFVINYQACTDQKCDSPKKEICRFVLKPDPSYASYAMPYIKSLEASLPQKLSSQLNLKEQIDKDTLILKFAFQKPIKQVSFLPDSKVILDKKQVWRKSPNGLVELKIPFPSSVQPLASGVLKIITKDKKVFSYQIISSKSSKTFAKSKSHSFFYYLIVALIGGLILNLMPCIFPIIAIKILGFVNQAHKEKKHSIFYAVCFCLGILVSFWAIAAIILISKYFGGAGLIWGFQLQNPYFIGFLICLLVILSLNFWGLFEFTLPWLPQVKKQGYFGSFCSGLLATLIATPCVAPFMSIALVTAFSSSALNALVIFTALGLGMGFPYLIFAFFPQLLKWMPKPGEWMITFKKVMGFLLFASAIWFMETLVVLTSVKFLIQFALILCFIAFCFWVYGQKISNLSSNRNKFFLLFVAVVIFCLFFLCKEIAYYHKLNKLTDEQKKQLIQQRGIFWETFTQEKFEKLKRQKKKVFVDFTAAWCASCIWNEKTVLEPNHKLFQKNNVVMLKADFTKKAPHLKKVLEKYNATGVPLYLYFDGEKVHKLPNLLTNKIIKQLFENDKD